MGAPRQGAQSRYAGAGAAAGQSFVELVVAAGVDVAGHAAPQFPPHAGTALPSGAAFVSADSAAEMPLPLAA